MSMTNQPNAGREQGIKPWSIYYIYRTGTIQLTRVMSHLTQPAQRHRLIYVVIRPNTEEESRVDVGNVY